jgi:hypothetical protein
MSFGSWLESFFSSILSKVTDFLSNVAHSIAVNGGPVLVELATAAVAAAEAQGGSGQDKFNAAVKAVTSGLTAQGVPVVLNAVNAAIEAAVANLQASQTATSTTTATAS